MDFPARPIEEEGSYVLEYQMEDYTGMNLSLLTYNYQEDYRHGRGRMIRHFNEDSGPDEVYAHIRAREFLEGGAPPIWRMVEARSKTIQGPF